MTGIRIEPRYPECRECTHCDVTRLVRACLGCKAGENFDPKIDDDEPSEAALYGMLREWSHDDA